MSSQPNVLPKVRQFIERLDDTALSLERQTALLELASYVAQKTSHKESAGLVFICTHNSRRSQLCQLWAQVFAYYFEIELSSFSGGTEVTSIPRQIIQVIGHSGMHTESSEGANPEWKVTFAENIQPTVLFSKRFDQSENPERPFAAVMTCSEADGKCPIVEGAEIRIALPYPDPKQFDHTNLEREKYLEINCQIAAEIKYVMKKASEMLFRQ